LPAATTERARALRLLARLPHGCTETVMLADGFKIAFLADLVRDGLVTAELTTAHIVWVQITALGREVLARRRPAHALQ
jgi:hypothetical protein